MEASAVQGHEGNVAWLKRNLREAQDTIVQLQEAQRLEKERHTKHSRECESGREGSPRGSRQCRKKTSLAGVRLCIQKHKKNLGIFEGHIPPKNSTILIMVMTIKHPLVVHISPANERATEIKVIVADSKFLTDTCSLGHLIKGIHRHIFSSYQDLTDDQILMENL
jgi:hypothetical protein